MDAFQLFPFRNRSRDFPPLPQSGGCFFGSKKFLCCNNRRLTIAHPFCVLLCREEENTSGVIKVFSSSSVPAQGEGEGNWRSAGKWEEGGGEKLSRLTPPRAAPFLGWRIMVFLVYTAGIHFRPGSGGQHRTATITFAEYSVAKVINLVAG